MLKMQTKLMDLRVQITQHISKITEFLLFTVLFPLLFIKRNTFWTKPELWYRKAHYLMIGSIIKAFKGLKNKDSWK